MLLSDVVNGHSVLETWYQQDSLQLFELSENSYRIKDGSFLKVLRIKNKKQRYFSKSLSSKVLFGIK